MSIAPQQALSHHEMKKAFSITNFKSNLKSSQEKKSAKSIVKDQQQEKQSCGETFSNFMEGIYFQIFITILTLISLFLFDFKTIALPKSSDFTIDILNFVLFGIFFLEIMINIKKPNYFCSFFFFLDLLSTVTILFDVEIISNLMYNTGGSGFQVSGLVSNSRASRTAARAVRIVKIFRLTRIAKLYKSTQKAKELKEQSMKQKLLQSFNKQADIMQTSSKNMVSIESMSNKQQNKSVCEAPKSKTQKPLKQNEGSNILAENEEFSNKESKISKVLNEGSIKRVIFIILAIMILIPLMDAKNYSNVSTQWDFMATFISSVLKNPKVSVQQINNFIIRQIDDSKKQDVYSDFLCITTPFQEIDNCDQITFSDYRLSQLGLFQVEINTNTILSIRGTNLTAKTTLEQHQFADTIVIFINYQRYNSVDAGFSIATTVFVCLTIIYLLQSFSSSINELVIIPIEKMFSMIKVVEEETQDQKKQVTQYETELVENSIKKIKKLMRMVFGYHGNYLMHEKFLNTRQISLNLKESTKKIYCVMAVCQIKQMATICKVLEEQYINFFNQVSKIVHNACYRYGGHCTKIRDDGFVIIFKIPQQELLQNQEKITTIKQIEKVNLKKSKKSTYLNILSDFSLFAMLKVIARLHKQPSILKYKTNQKIMFEFGSGYNFQVSAALTLGWCNQGIIGSCYKIDSLVLGDKINQLQNILKYCNLLKDSNVLLSHSLYKNVSSQMKKWCLHFDSIKSDNNSHPFKIYRVDTDSSNITPSKTKKKNYKKTEILIKKALNMIHLSSFQSIIDYNASQFVSKKKELREILKKHMDSQYRRLHICAFDAYVKGEWVKAEDNFSSLMKAVSLDPSFIGIYEFMKKQQFKANKGWKGFRYLKDILKE